MYDWADLGAGVFVRRYRSLDLNIGAVICDDGVLLVDTRSHHREAGELKEDLARLTPYPVRWVVNTHHHWDHTFGNACFRPAPIWGHRRCAEVLVARGEQMRRQVQAWDPGQAGWFAEVRITPPDHTFGRSHHLTAAGRAVELHHLGRAHTDNDLVVRVPDCGVVFAGDLVEESGPPAFDDSYPLEWPDAMERLLPLLQGPVVPGHGAVVAPAFVATQAGDLAEVASLAMERHASGMSASDAAAAGGPFPPDALAAAFTRVWPGLEVGG